MEIAILFVLVLLNGIFAMAEIALVTARKSRLQRLADNGDSAAALAVRLGQAPTQFLSTVQIGITAIGILNGIVGEAVFAGPLSAFFADCGLDPKTASLSATVIVVAGITYLSIVVGELVPKRLAQLHAEAIARVMARPIAFLALLSRPFVFLLSVSTDGLLFLLGKRDSRSSKLTVEDISAVLDEGSQSGLIEMGERQIVRNVFRLDDRQIVSLMTPRSEIVSLDVTQSLEDRVKTLVSSTYSRFPVCRGGIHDVLGVIPAKRLLRQSLMGYSLDFITDHLSPAVYVPESLTGIKLLEQFRESGARMVFVVDEYGEILGLITLHDLLEALAGEFRPRDPEDVWAVRRGDGSWLVDGLIPLPELQDRLGMTTIPEGLKHRCHTLSGLLMWLIGKVPGVGDSAEWEGWHLEVVGLDGNRIDKVLARRPGEESGEGEK